MSFGWSVGDIAAAISLLTEVIQALSNAEGAASEYQENVRFLQGLIGTLKPLEDLSQSGKDVSLGEEIRDEIEAIRIPLNNFKGVLEKYQPTLGPEGKAGNFSHFGKKLQYHFWASKKTKELEEKIGRHVQTLNMYLHAHEIGIINDFRKSLPGQLQTSFTEGIQQIRSVMKDELHPIESLIHGMLERLAQQNQALLLQLEKNAEVVETMKSLLETVSKTNQKAILNAILPPTESPDGSLHTELPKSPKSAEHLKADLIPDLSLLGYYCQKPFSRTFTLQASQFCADRRTGARLREWWEDPNSQLLWIQEASEAPSPSRIASSVCIASEAKGLSLAAYFCRRDLGGEGNAPDKIEMLVEMIYSILYQVAQAVYDRPNNVDVEIDTSQFGRLDGSAKSLGGAFKLLQDLKGFLPNQHIFVIDGFPEIEDVTNVEVTENTLRLLDILRPSFERSKGKLKVVKTLITTRGQSLTLLKELGLKERLDVSIPEDEDLQPLASAMQHVFSR